MEFYARKTEDGRFQFLKDHIEGVKSRCGKNAFNGFENILKLIGLLHDFGKYSLKWQDYLKNGGETVPHSPHGAHFIFEKYDKNDNINRLTCEIIYFVVLAHHGILDASKEGESTISIREEKFNLKYENEYIDCKNNFLENYSVEIIDELFEKSKKEIENYIKTVKKNGKFFDLAFLIRMLLSKLMDSDWSDSASFELDTESEYNSDLEKFSWDYCIKSLENFKMNFDRESEINKIRTKISEECKESGKRKSGIYRLDVPTGAGKTLAVMDFALNHAKIHNKDRIIYCAPFKSILEQTGKVYRECLFEDMEISGKYLIEHFGEIVKDEEKNTENISNENKFLKYLTDSWNSPIILTTTVQLLLTFISSNKSFIRRSCKLYNSIIIVDEFQSIPITSINIFNFIINFLKEHFNATIVLCTATQPPFEEIIKDEKYDRKEKIQKIEFFEKPDLVSDYSNEEVFKRNVILDKRRDGLGYSPEELKDIILERMKKEKSLLVILNTRNAVSKLYDLIKNESCDFEIRGLSNNMTPFHRFNNIKEIRNLLKSDKKLIVISTPLIEAGVDVSFTGVIRSISSADSIVQSAGRCNRNGENDSGEVWIVNLKKDFENTSKLPEIESSKSKMEAKLNNFSKKPEDYDFSISSKKFLDEYFISFFKDNIDLTYYPINLEKNGVFDRKSKDNIFSLINNKEKNDGLINQKIKTAGDYYKPIFDNGILVLVENEYTNDIICGLGSDSLNLKEKIDLLKKSEIHSVSIYDSSFYKLKENGIIREIKFLDKSIYYIVKENYGEIGLISEIKEFDSCII